MKTIFGILALILLTTLSLFGQSARTPLDGPWRFALDPVGAGEDERWFAAEQFERSDKITVQTVKLAASGRGYSIHYDNQEIVPGTLRPGEHQSLTIRVTVSTPEIAPVRPANFVILRETFNKSL